MTRFSLRAALFFGCAAPLGASSFGTPADAAPAVHREVPALPEGEIADTLPAVPPVSTAAGQIEVSPATPLPPGRAAPTFRPDGGAELSGLTNRRGEPVDVRTDPVRTLREAIALAYQTNPRLLAARADARSADFQVPQARSAYGPTLSANGGYAFTRQRVEVLPGDYNSARGWASQAGLVLSQPVWTFGRNAASVAGAEASSEFQRESLRVTEAQVLTNVVAAYVSVLRDAAAVRIARENLALIEQQLDVVETRYMVRDLTLTDLDQTRTRLELGRAQLLEAEGRLGISQKAFLQIIGTPPGELEPPQALDVSFRSLEDAYAYAEANSALIRAAQARERISRAAVRAAKAELGPRVDLRGSYQYGSVTPFSDDLRTNSLVGQVVVSQTLFDSGLRSARINEVQQANEADWRLLDSVYRDTRQAVGSAWDELAASRSALANYRTAIAAAQRAYEGALIQQQSGDRSVLDVLDLARDLLTVRNNYTFTLAQEYIARADLLAAAGLLEAPQIIPEIHAYDAQAHYQRVKGHGDIPLLTPLLHGIDSLTVGDVSGDRPSRDAGAQQALAPAMPLPPPVPEAGP